MDISKNIRRFLLALNLVLNIFLVYPANGQNKNTLCGYVSDAITGEELIGTSVYNDETSSGTITNTFGFYSISLPPGSYNLRFSFTGYESFSITIHLNSDQKLNIQMKPSVTELKACVIRADEDTICKMFSTSVNRISMDPIAIKSVPVIFGERDLLKTIQLLPGIQASGDGNSGFYVRGGGLDQNLILIDDAPVYNPSHLLGFFSVFNSDAIKDIQVYKGGIPPVYGGRLSSVVDVSMKNGDLNKYHLNGGAGLISSRLTAEGPIAKDRSSFIISGRRTYGDLFLPFINDSVVNSSRLYFYDMNCKLNYKINPSNRVYLSLYKGRDYFKYTNNFNYDWGNNIISGKWNHVFNPSMFLNSTLVWSNYDYSIGFGESEHGFGISSGMNNLQLKEDIQYFIKPGRTVKFGLSSSWHTFPQVKINTGPVSQVSGYNGESSRAFENSAYLMNERTLGEHFSIVSGMRFSTFLLTGPGKRYLYGNEGIIVDTVHYELFDQMAFWYGLEPRFTTSWITKKGITVKASVSRGRQYIHLLSNSTTTKPTDLWIPSSEIIKPQIAVEYSAGISKSWLKNSLEMSMEFYYKDLLNQIEYRDGTDLILNPDIESQLVFGKGYSKGIEFLLRKNGSRLSGWVGYTLSKSMRSFKEIDDGSPFPARQDRTHDISVVCNYQFNDIWNISTTWVYATGNAVTYPGGKYYINGQAVTYYSVRNGARMPDYHRMDVAASWKIPCRNPEYKSTLEVSVYNLYSRENAWSIDFRQNEDDPTRTEAVQLTLFKMIPSVSYNFSF